MIYKELILGLLFSLGVLALKSGLGLGYCLRQRGRGRTALLAAFAAIYLAVFLGAYFLLKAVDLAGYLKPALAALQAGMLIHFVLAGLMLAWGIALLKKPKTASGQSRGWLLLALPCPVCLTAIFFTVGLILSLAPGMGIQAAFWLFGIYLALSFLSAGAWVLLQQRLALAPEKLLGAAMTALAAYFLLSLAMLPQTAGLENIYRLALHQGKAVSPPALNHILGWLLVGLAFISGFYAAHSKFRRKRSWK